LYYPFTPPPTVAVFALSQVAFYFAFKYIIGSLDPLKAKKQEAKSKSAKSLAKLGVLYDLNHLLAQRVD
jgi:hypothetical protein